MKDIIGDGFLYAVPKSRRTLEKRMMRKFGHPQYIWKMLVPKTNLISCNTCGADYDPKRLCRKYILIEHAFLFGTDTSPRKNYKKIEGYTYRFL